MELLTAIYFLGAAFTLLMAIGKFGNELIERYDGTVYERPEHARKALFWLAVAVPLALGWFLALAFFVMRELLRLIQDARSTPE